MKNNDYFLKSIIKTIEWYKKNAGSFENKKNNYNI